MRPRFFDDLADAMPDVVDFTRRELVREGTAGRQRWESNWRVRIIRASCELLQTHFIF